MKTGEIDSSSEWITTNKNWGDVELSELYETTLFYDSKGRSNHLDNRNADLIEELPKETHPEYYL